MEIDKILMGERIRIERKRFGYTREQFAELLDITPKFCSDIELGLKGVSIETLVNISEKLTISTDYILFGKREYDDKLTDLIARITPAERTVIEHVIDVILEMRDTVQITES